MAKASSNDILGLGKPLRSGQGAIRQFWNPIKTERGPAAAWLKPAPTTFWAWGSLWDRDRGTMAPAAAWLNASSNEIGTGGHPSVLKSASVSFGSPKQVRGSGTVDGGFARKQRSTPTVVPGAALPWPRRGRVGGYRIHICYSISINIVLFSWLSFHFESGRPRHAVGQHFAKCATFHVEFPSYQPGTVPLNVSQNGDVRIIVIQCQ